MTKTITEIPKLPLRASDAHKGTFGKVLIIAGSRGMTGAAAIAGKSALRSGAGLVRVATPESVLPIVASIEPCFTTIPLPQDEDGTIAPEAIDTILPHLDDNDIIAIGPGLGQSRGVRELVNTLIAREGIRLVIDADAINSLAKSIDWIQKRKASIILTPHPGEMKNLWTNTFREPLPADRTEQATKLADRSGSTVVLKGAATVVTDAKKLYINTTGNPGMATAGSGDVLTGIIAALCGQSLDNFNAAVLAVYTHGLAGDIAAEKIGPISMIATDIIDSLGHAFKKL